ncbi:MAG: hypothetical protein HZB38_00115 [Planctomycetes bacterium]|nr:hypothetical protein [Planctomycetota bacterium]
MNSLRPYYPELQTDLESLRLATLPHTSGAAPPRPYGRIENMGLGLFFSKEIAWRSGGSFWLASGKGLLGLTASDEHGPRRVYRTINPWPGTLAVIHLPDRASSDFADVLAVCHKLAMQFQSDATVGALEFVDASAELPDDAERIAIAPIQDDLAATHQLRTERLLPSLASGRMVALEFENVRFLSTSVGQALLSDAFRTRGSLTRLVFRNCTRATELAIRTIAAFAKAAYKRRPE